MLRTLLILLLAAGIISSCNRGPGSGEGFVFPEDDVVPSAEAEMLSTEAIDDIIRNIASPVEIAALLQSLEVPFSENYLAPTRDADRINTNFERALMLGVYGADLGYINIYERSGSAVEVLRVINRLADGLRVGQFFDFEALRRLSTSRSNLDSLLYLSISSYNNIDDHLREENRGHLSALIITGVWIEGQYLITQVANNFPDQMLVERIAEQKLIINDLLMLLNPYCDVAGDDYAKLCNEIRRLKDAYSEVSISYTPGEPETIEVDGRLTIVQRDETHIEISEEQLQDIIEISKEVRNGIVEGR